MSMWLQPCGCVTEAGHPVVTCPLHDAADEIDQGRWEGEGGYVNAHGTITGRMHTSWCSRNPCTCSTGESD